MREETDIQIVDEGNEGIEGYQPIKKKYNASEDRYIEMEDIPKDKFKSNVSGAIRNTGSFISNAAQKTGSFIGGAVKGAHGYLKEKGEQYKANAPQREERRKERDERQAQRRAQMQERIKTRGPPPSMFGNIGQSQVVDVPRAPSMFGGGMGSMPSMGGFGSQRTTTTNMKPRMDGFKLDPWKGQPSLMGGMGGIGGPAFGRSITKRKVTRHKVHRRKTRTRTTKKFVVVNGKKYYRK